MNAICIVEECDRPTRTPTAELCNTHYFRVRRTGTVGTTPIAVKGQPKPRCSIDGCHRPTVARGVCGKHYWRLSKNGSPLAVRPDRNGPNNNYWCGDSIGIGAAHERVKAIHGPAAGHACRHCGAQARHWAYDHLDADEKHQAARGQLMPYSVSPKHYIPLCVPCHKRYDLSVSRTVAKPA